MAEYPCRTDRTAADAHDVGRREVDLDADLGVLLAQRLGAVALLVRKARRACDEAFAFAGGGQRRQRGEEVGALRGVELEGPERTAADVVAKSDWVVPAVVPAILEDVLGPVLPALRDKIVVSIVSGWDFARYEAFLAPGTHHISTIPNTPIAIGEGVLACESTHNLTEAEYAQFEETFGKIALIVPVTAAQFGPAGTLGGCTPAFTAMYLEALGDAGVKYGLSRAAAYQMAAQVLIGTGMLYLESGLHPGVLKDGVCSPGGTTIRGVAELEKRAFRGTVISAVDAIEGN